MFMPMKCGIKKIKHFEQHFGRGTDKVPHNFARYIRINAVLPFLITKILYYCHHIFIQITNNM